MHLIDDDQYVDVYFTQWNSGGSFAYYRTEIQPNKGLVSTVPGTTPFYTTYSNPVAITLNEGESELITWPVVATGGNFKTPTYEFFAFANLSSDPYVSAISERVNITTLYPQVNISWIDPTTNIDVLPGDTREFKANVSCSYGNCGTINVGIDPPPCNGGCITLNVNGREVVMDSSYRMDAADFTTARANCQAIGGDITNFDEAYAYLFTYRMQSSGDHPYCGYDATNPSPCQSNPAWGYSSCCATSPTEGCGYMDLYGCSCHECNMFGWDPGGYTCAFRSGKSGMLKMDPSEKPFYTTSQNPITISLNEDESQEVSWNVVVSGGDPNYPTSTFFATANLSSEQRIKDETDDINVTISYPKVDIEWVNPTSDVNVSADDFFNITVTVTCSQRDCGNVIVSLDPEGNYYFDSSWGSPDSVTPSVSLWRGSGGGLCNSIYDYCAPRWQGGTTNPSGTEWGVGICKNANSFSDFFSSACGGRCGNNLMNKDLCMHELSTDVYYDIYFTNWGRSWSNYFTYYRADTGIKRKGGLVSTTIGATPFYTIDDNPKTVWLDEGQATEVSWRVMPNTDSISAFIFFAFANVSDIMTVNDETSRILVKPDTLPPNLTVTLVSPSASTSARLNSVLDFTVNISCQNGNCGEVVATIDPIGNYYYDSSSGVPDSITPSVSISRGGGGTICNPMYDYCAPRWQGGTTNPSGTEWAVGTCDSATSFTDFFSAACGGSRCGNSLLNRDLCMHAIAEDKYYDIYFTNWGRSWSNYFTYYRTTDKSLVPTDFGAKPFYTTFSNPYTLTLGKGESQLVTWPLYVTGGPLRKNTSEFFVNATVSSNRLINATSDKVNITIQYPNVGITWIDPTTNIDVLPGETKLFKVEVSCYDGDCGTVNVGLDPPSCNGGCVDLIVNGKTIQADRNYRTDAGDFTTARNNCKAFGGDITNFDESLAWVNWYAEGSLDIAYCGRDSDATQCNSHPTWMGPTCCATSETDGCGTHDYYGCSCHDCSWWPYGYVCAFRSAKSGMVSMDPSTVPFYTTSQNPTTVFLNEGQSQEVDWNVIVSGGDPNYPTSTFYASANITSDVIIREKTNDLNVTILYPEVDITWVTPTADAKAEKNELMNMTVLVSCSQRDCGNVIVSLDPIGTYYYDSSSGVPDSITPAVSISRGGGGTICNSLFDNCRPRWQGGVTNPSGTEWAAAACLNANSFTDFFSAACGGSRCGNSILNKDLCMHELSTDTYYDIYFTNWGRGWSNYFTYYRSESGTKIKNGLVPVGSGTPFYTIDDNPKTIWLDEGQTTEVGWRVIPTGDTNTLYAFFAFANVSDIMSVNDQTNSILINTTNAIDITIQSPITTTYLTSVAPVYFNLSLSNPASSCEYTLDDWATTNPMALDGTAMFASAEKSTGWTTGTYTAKFRCTTPTGKVNDWMFVTFDVITSSGATYKRPITLSVSSGATSTGYQVPLSLSAANMGSNFDWNCQQIRFISPIYGSFLPYYTESCDPMGQTATIWVKSDQAITTSGYTIYAYYGNPAWSSTSNKDSVFETYSMFPDYTGWSGASSTSTCSPGGQSMMGGFGVWGSGASTQKNLGNLPAGDYEVKFDYYFIDSWDGESGLAYWNTNNIWSLQHFCCSPPYSSGTTNLCGQSYAQWYESTEFALNPRILTVTHSGGAANLRFTSSLDQDPSDEAWGVDNIRVRKSYSPNPTYSIGAESPGD
jgi:aerobic-type carbon monoxide dehydrogenase small subunit (CoxS/CutS family)